MCGIAGFVMGEHSSKAVGQQSLLAMTRALVHRGPDDEGYFWSPTVGLGSRRLSIIDLSPSGRMPIFNETQTIAVIQNGEIYNFKKLRAELEKKGHRFTSKTDTEVIVHAYEELGESCFAQLQGMYAVAIWDQRLKRLLLARDRFGEKPLYYFEEAGCLAFGSELKALYQYPFFSGELNWEVLDQFLTLSYILAPHTPFVGTKKLLPGYYLVFDQASGDHRVAQYWSPPERIEPASRKTEREYVAEFDRLFSESVQSRMVSDVPVGAFLSGGIDSSLVVASMMRLNAGPIRTFSIGYSGSQTHNENPVAEQVAQYLHVDHETLHVRLDDVLGVIELLPDLWDEPIGDPAFIGVYLITKLAKSKGITVMLSGDGGDELFLGYPIYHWVSTLSILYRLPSSLRKGLANAVELIGGLRADSRLAKAACSMRHDRLEDAAYYLAGNGAWSIDELRRLKGESGLQVRNESFLSAFDGPGRTALDRESRAIFLTYLPDNNLTRMDRASMANAVETRAPFLDSALSDFSARLPLDMKLRGSQQKYILRRALAGIVPPGILQMPKHGFDALPMAEWMRTSFGFLIKEFLDPAHLKSQGIYDPRTVELLLQQHRQGGRFNHWWKLWLLIVLQMWIKHKTLQIVKPDPPLDLDTPVPTHQRVLGAV